MARPKKEAYNLLRYGLKLYLPEYRYTPFQFLKELLNEEKSIIYKNKLSIVDVPKWNEFNIDDIYDFAKQDERFSTYLPNWTE